jgi:hypothetical protein
MSSQPELGRPAVELRRQDLLHRPGRGELLFSAAVGLQLSANFGEEGQVGVPPDEPAPAGARARGAQRAELGTRAHVGVRGSSWSKRAVDLVVQEQRLLAPAPPLPLL